MLGFQRFIIAAAVLLLTIAKVEAAAAAPPCTVPSMSQLHLSLLYGLMLTTLANTSRRPSAWRRG
ncbi:hypothetical protein BC834DRAFT_106552 [Gloeopeniophorella convolvens]|nr:hypothetical protein BC834DRAFT_106552 [Gloeopeniophorella convolvens]